MRQVFAETVETAAKQAIRKKTKTGTVGACAGLVRHVHPNPWRIASLLSPSKRK
jgi:hypothetical protein